VAEIKNPYIAGTPIPGPEMFFGRKDVFAFIRQTMLGHHRDNVLVLYGQQRTGKTSLLYQMGSRLGPGYLCIFINLHSLALEGLGGFLWELADHIVDVLHDNYRINLVAPSYTQFSTNPRHAFENEFLSHVWPVVGNRHILLMLDEATRFQEQVKAGKLESDIFEYLRHLMQHYEQLNFLFSLSRGLEELEKEYAFLFNVALYKKISFLDRDAINALITQPVQNYYAVTPAAQEKIFQITFGHPFYTQLLCHCLFNHWRHLTNRVTRQQRGKLRIEIDCQDVDAVLDEAIELGLAQLKQAWDESTPGEKAVIAGMSELLKNEAYQKVEVNLIRSMWAMHGGIIPKREMMNAIKSLSARDIIFGRDVEGLDTYSFTVDLQRLWVQKYEQLEWVKEEIADALLEWSSERRQRVSRRRFLLAGSAGLFAVGGLIWLTRSEWLQVFSPRLSPTPRPTVIQTAPIIPTLPQPGLEPSYHAFVLSVNPDGLLNNLPSAAEDVKRQVLAQTFLKGRRVGFVAVYAGTLTDADAAKALEVATKVIDILKTIDGDGFNKAVYTDPLFLFGDPGTVVRLNVYLYAR